MLIKKDLSPRTQMEIAALDDLVPENHLVRQVEDAINLDFIYPIVEPTYSKETGRPSIDPVVLMKLVMLQHLFGIPSMRQTIKEVEVNVAYRWYLGYGFSEKIPHFSTYSKNYQRRFKDTNLFEEIFSTILDKAIEKGFIHPEQVFIDGTHMKANANKRKYSKEEVDVAARHYQKQLDEEIKNDRESHNKKPLKPIEEPKKKRKVTSTSDPDAGMFHKGEKERCFAYNINTACDDSNFILNYEVTPGNVHDSVAFDNIYNKVYKRFGKEMEIVAVDAGYITPYNCKKILDSDVLPAMPYKRPMTKKGFFKKYDYVYDEYYDCYICPNNEILTYTTTNRDGYKEYKSDPQKCVKCPHLAMCTASKNHQKLVTRHVWQEYVEEANHLRHTPLIKGAYKRRKETIERVFADAKERHGMRYTRLKGLTNIRNEVTLIFACMNLKKLAKRC
ncbi:IS1182 family transposase [Vallitalea guaymasensis]|uniref:IS1182 family transposase n=1 Tax=Vallitalea guaymasensis TaxID=1185412 RepID=UPI000DE4F208|nr:IS1182 family transposase [Vallitalea guaymasensis]